MEKELLMYSQIKYSPYVALARDLLQRYKIPFREIDITNNATATEQLKTLTGNLNLPTLVLSKPNSKLPLAPPTPLVSGQSSRGLNRDTIITQPNNKQLENWLHQHGFLNKPYTR